ncbi:MAG: hypothetical protein ISQ65_04150 [Pseudomonadales bacterium]|nr:hypothetical protein [Pseudomonadales bacterium]
MTKRASHRHWYLECKAYVFAQLANRVFKKHMRSKAAAVSAMPQDN